MFSTARVLVKDLPRIVYVLRGISRKMAPISPPDDVKGMMEWKPELFDKKVMLPCLRVKAEHLSFLKAPLKNYVLKMPNIINVQECENDDEKMVILNPATVQTFSDLESAMECFNKISVNEKNFGFKDYQLSSDNWSPNEKLKHIIPEGEEISRGFSRIGHIIHLNLRDNTIPYKKVIGEILLEMPGIRTIVAKTSNIDNTYRNFELEVLAGEKDFEVTTKESGNSFSFDFSKVYWNPRLSTEHERIVKKLKSDSILFDACAGVGPFSIPAGRKCRVFANDLNPESYKWLMHNAKLNKIKDSRISCYNMDARDFIKDVFVKELISLNSQLNEDCFEDLDLHITMNLPALAVTLIDVFQGLLWEHREVLPMEHTPLPLLHVYTFSKADDAQQDVKSRVEQYLDTSLDTQHLKEISFVRSVAPNKDMFRATVKIPREVLFRDISKRKSEENPLNLSCKKIKQ